MTKGFVLGWLAMLGLLGASAHEAQSILAPLDMTAAVDTVTYGDQRIVYTVATETSTVNGQLRRRPVLTTAPAGALMLVFWKAPLYDSAMVVTGDTFAMSPTDSATAKARATAWGVTDPYTVTLAWHNPDTPIPPDPISGLTVVMASDTLVVDWTETADDYQVAGGLNDSASSEDYNDSITAGPNKRVVSTFGSYYSCVRAYNVVGLSDSRCNSVTYAAAPPPDPPTPTTEYVNEPAGFDSIMGRPFTTAAEPSGWAGSGLASSSFSIRDANVYNPAGADPPGIPAFAPTDSVIGEAAYVPSLCAGCGPFTQYFTIPSDSAYTELYISTWTQISSNFYMPSGGSLRTKTMFIELCDPSGNNCRSAIFPSFRGSVNSPWNMAFSTQGTAEPGDGAIGFSNGSMVAGQWHQVELYMKLNTTTGLDSANADGLVKMWLDGVLKIDEDSIRYRGVSAYSDVNANFLFSGRIKWAGTYGGVGSPPEKMYVWLAHYYASGKK